VDEEVVRHIARLARIELREGELGRLARELATIVGYFDKLGELDTEGVEPLLHAVEEQNVLRPDEAGDSLGVEAALANAPRQDGSFFCVPRVIAEPPGRGDP
jgi:aspartyl-tRNA(Asn)/glutamyl-tRNA(Gln) amidotransferase subunit C